MGVTCFNKQFATPVSPARMFKALILDSHNLFPKLVPQSIKSVEFLQGDGGVGSVKLIKFHEWCRFKYVKYIINVLDKENFMSKYTLIEGEVLGDNLESVVYEVKFETSGDGGCICKVATEFHTKGDHEIKEDAIQDGKDKATGLYKVVEAHLLANPDIYS